MSQDFKVEKPKVHFITSEELSELSFYVTNLKSREIEVRAWRVMIYDLQTSITKRLLLDKPDIELDWGKIFPKGELQSRKKAISEVKVTENKNVSDTPQAA